MDNLKMNNLKNVGFCDFCKKLKLRDTYFVYRLDFNTNLDDYNIGILAIANDLGNWLMSKSYRLSATQVILLRPDITLEFLRHKYNTEEEHVGNYSLVEAEICKKCFKEYEKEIPVK